MNCCGLRAGIVAVWSRVAVKVGAALAEVSAVSVSMMLVRLGLVVGIWVGLAGLDRRHAASVSSARSRGK